MLQQAATARTTRLRHRVSTLLALCLSLSGVSVTVAAGDTPTEAILRERSAEFTPEIIAVSPRVYTAVGYSPANISMIVGSEGAVIIDTGLNNAQASIVAQKFREITDKPVKAIIYTHGHGDHTGGATAFIGDTRPQIWARANFGSESRPLAAAGLEIQRKRGAYQAGFTLPDALRINNGIAPAVRPGRDDAFVADHQDTTPTHTFVAGRHTLEIAGLRLELVAAPGETDDHLYVWYPQQRVLFAGDNYYKSFPNLYAIRGTPYRDVFAWINSLSHMLNEQPAAVVPGHTRPVLGEESAQTALRNHRDAIRFVHDRTVVGMNLGLTPDELVEYVKLPARFTDNPDLGEYYGSVASAVRSIFSGYLGWYDGNPTQLSPLSPAEEARRWSDLVGGREVLLEQANSALERGDLQWAAQLADHLLALAPEERRAKQVKAEALDALARQTVNALMRNYYLSVARELRSDAGH